VAVNVSNVSHVSDVSDASNVSDVSNAAVEVVKGALSTFFEVCGMFTHLLHQPAVQDKKVHGVKERTRFWAAPPILMEGEILIFLSCPM
jgi:hypothetical protein